jgi:hypothetical protein
VRRRTPKPPRTTSAAATASVTPIEPWPALAVACDVSEDDVEPVGGGGLVADELSGVLRARLGVECGGVFVGQVALGDAATSCRARLGTDASSAASPAPESVRWLTDSAHGRVGG